MIHLTADEPLPLEAPLSRLVTVGLIVLGVHGGMGLRAVANPWLGPTTPFVFAFPAVVMVALLAGAPPALVTAGLCAMWAIVPVLPPHLVSDTATMQVATFLGSSLLIAMFREHVRSAPSFAPVAGGARVSKAERWLRVSIVLAIVVPTVFFVTTASIAWRSALDDAQSGVDRAARVAQEHASRVIETTEVIARQIALDLRDETDAEISAREPALHRWLQDVAFVLPQIQSIWVWDANGLPLVSNRFSPLPSGLDISERDYFQQHRAGVHSWVVSERLMSRTTNEVFFDISMRRPSSDGRFTGVISISLHPEYFTRFYEELSRSEPGLRLLLLREDGRILAPATSRDRVDDAPEFARAMAKKIVDGRGVGDFSGAWPDGTFRFNALRHIDEHPLYVVASLDRATVVATWLRQLGILAAFTFPPAIGLAYVAWIGLSRTRRELAALEQLREESNRRLRVEDALRQAQKLEALGHLTGGVAHDFNNLLMVVSNNAQLLRLEAPEFRDSPRLAALLRAVSSGTKLTRQLLAFSRRQALRPETIDLREVLPSIIDLMRTTLGRGIAAQGHSAADTSPVEVDRSELELALLNLAINARDAMSDVHIGSGRVVVLTRNASHDEFPELPPNRYVAITVSDNGSGVPEDVLPHVFEPFFTTKSAGQGTGLGLAQVYGFAAQAGGTARIASNAGEGTTVTIALPASTKPIAAVVAEPTAIPRDLHARVLLVEDNEDVAEATVALLERIGSQVSRVASAMDALAALDRDDIGPLDAVVTDIVMPGSMDGIDLALALRARRPGLGVVLMTGYTNHLNRAIAAGLEVLPKPVSPQTLAVAIEKARDEGRADETKR